jgi:hypothetical protein
MNPTDKIPLSLEVQQWQVVVNLLAEGPYKLSAPLIATLQEQFNATQQPAQALEVEPAVTNGSGMAHPRDKRSRPDA